VGGSCGLVCVSGWRMGEETCVEVSDWRRDEV